MGAYKNAIVNGAGNSLAFGSVVVGYTALLTSVVGKVVVLFIDSTLNGDVVLSLDGGTTDWRLLPAGTSTTIDFGAQEAIWNGTLSVKYNSAASTSGFIAASYIKVP